MIHIDNWRLIKIIYRNLKESSVISRGKVLSNDTVDSYGSEIHSSRIRLTTMQFMVVYAGYI